MLYWLSGHEFHYIMTTIAYMSSMRCKSPTPLTQSHKAQRQSWNKCNCWTLPCVIGGHLQLIPFGAKIFEVNNMVDDFTTDLKTRLYATICNHVLAMQTLINRQKSFAADAVLVSWASLTWTFSCVAGDYHLSMHSNLNKLNHPLSQNINSMIF